MTGHSDLHALFGHSEEGLASPAGEYLAAREALARAEKAQALARQALEEAEQKLHDAMTAAGTSSFAYGGETLTASRHSYYSLPAGALDEADVYRWLVVTGGRDLVRRTVHAGSLTAHCRRLEEAGRHVHPRLRLVVKKVIKLKREKA